MERCKETGSPQQYKFDVILYGESILQYRIIEKLLLLFQEKVCLVILKDKVRISNLTSNHKVVTSTIDIHGFKKMFFFSNFKNLFSNQKYECNLFIASFLTGNNSLMWESKIKYNELGLIDDGTGTLFALKFKRDFINKRLKKTYKIYNFLSGVLKNSKITYTNYSIQGKINHYYSIYFSKHTIFQNVTYIKLFELPENYNNINAIAFIGQPLINLRQIEKHQLISILNNISDHEGKKVYYFLHPREKESAYKIEKNDKIEFVKINYNIEKYLCCNRFSKIITFYSSSVINLKVLFEEFNDGLCDNLFYYKHKNNDEVINNYYNLFLDFNIDEYILTDGKYSNQ